jgi:hypothetical protein
VTGILVVARVRRVLLAMGVAFAVLPVGSALAGTIGQVGSGEACSEAVSAVWLDASYAVPPGGGTITSFSFQADSSNAGQQVDFVVLSSPASGTSYTVVGTTGLVSLGSPTGTTVETFPASIPVQAGDVLGFWVSADLGGLSNCLRSPGSGDNVAERGQGEPSVGDPVQVSFLSAPFDLNESANLTTPLPTGKDQCKDGGWQTFGVFKNQGDCVSFVATRGKNAPSGS